MIEFVGLNFDQSKKNMKSSDMLSTSALCTTVGQYEAIVLIIQQNEPS